MTGLCSICQKYKELNRHHFIPKYLHTKLKKSKKYNNKQLKVTLTTCKDCHDQIHYFYTVIELERHYNNYNDLINSEKVVDYIMTI